jgi:hypothetical protein
MDGNLEYEQNLTTLPVAVLVIAAASNRIEHLSPLAPDNLTALSDLPPKTLRRLDAQPSA